LDQFSDGADSPVSLSEGSGCKCDAAICMP
jgi:hypothetical protein